MQAGKASKSDKLMVVDHSKVNYPPFRRHFYIEPTELARLNATQLAALRHELDGLKVKAARSLRAQVHLCLCSSKQLRVIRCD